MRNISRFHTIHRFHLKMSPQSSYLSEPNFHMESHLGDLFLHCNNLVAMKEFYTEIIGWDYEIYNLEYKHLTYKISEKSYLVIMESNEAKSMEGWVKGPVFTEGDRSGVSISIKVEKHSKYRQIVEKLQSRGDTFWKSPKFVVNYWSFIVKDPSGLTIDVFHEPQKKPDVTDWGS